MKILFIIISVLIASLFVDLEKRTLIDNKIEILVPKDFKEMSEELINIKYPGKNRPKIILTDESAKTNLAFNLLENAADSSLLEAYKIAFVNSYKTKFPSATWINEGMKKINGKKVGFMQVITDAIDQRIYNYVFFTDVNGKLLLGTFNCVEKDMKTWQPVSEQIVSSLQVK